MDRVPLWAHAVLTVAMLVSFPLLNALGVLEALGLKDLPGTRFKPRPMFMAVALVVAAFVWVVALVRHVPDTSRGITLLLVPPAIALAAAIFCVIRGMS